MIRERSIHHQHFPKLCIDTSYVQSNSLQASRFSAVQHNYADSVEAVKAMDSLRSLVKRIQMSPKARVYGLSYLWAESYKVNLKEFLIVVYLKRSYVLGEVENFAP